jgi:hypothetical protein
MTLGDFDTGTVVYFKFTTYNPSTGAPFTLAGTPAISVYKDNSVTQSTTGVTLTVDFDTVTGLHHVAVDTSADGTFYAAGSFFDVVITTGTVNAVSAVGTVVGRFTLRKTSALKPTTAGRTLDVSAGGEAGIDWANIGSPTTAVNLSATNIDVDQVVASVSGAVGSVTGAVGSVTGAVGSVTGNVGGNVVGSVGSVTAGVTVTTNNDKTGYAVAAGGIAATSFAAGAIDAAAIAANAIGASELAQDAAQEIADEVLNRNLAGGASGDSRNVRNALRSLRNKAAISGGTLTVYQEDDASAAWTAAVTTTAGDPIDSIDPA